MKWFILILSGLIVTGCNMKNKEPNPDKVEFSMNQPSLSEKELKKAVLYEGDIEAYKSLRIAYLDHTFQEEFLLYATIMANRYNYPQAYFDVFTCLTDVFMSDLNQIDTTTANLAIDYLIKAYQKQHHQAKEIVEEYSIEYNEKKNKEQILKIFE